MATPSNSDELQTKRRPRMRFTLLTLFLVTALVCLSISHWLLLVENRRLKGTLSRRNSELGYLNVDDPQAVYIRDQPGLPWALRRYRVYLPMNRRFKLHVDEGPAGDGLPLTPGSPHPSGRFTVVVNVNDDGDELTVLSLASGPDRVRRSIPLKRPVAMEMRTDWYGSQQELDPEEPIILLDHPASDPASRLRVYFTVDE